MQDYWFGEVQCILEKVLQCQLCSLIVTMDYKRLWGRGFVRETEGAVDVVDEFLY